MEPVINEESNVPTYSLPDPLMTQSGKRIDRAADWPARRAELLGLFQRHLYGFAPDSMPEVQSEVVAPAVEALEGRALMKQIEVILRHRGRDLRIGVLIFVPKETEGPVPAFLGMNFYGNHTIQPDPRIRLHRNWTRNSEGYKITDNRASEESRGVRAFRWPVEMIVGKGFGLCTVYCGDVDPDFDDGFKNGVHGLFEESNYSVPSEERWGTIHAWAWGLSRVLDSLETEPLIDASRVIVMGHSRLGKTALWAGATDKRFAAAISNDSGCGGAALFRRRFGERLVHMNENFPHWLNGRSGDYIEKESQLPIDQHQLVALIAPRPVYVASASEDLWADPHGEFLSLVHADPVYRLLTADGLPTKEWPKPEQPLRGRLSYHIRSGKHNILAYDWEQYLNFGRSVVL